MAAILLKLIFSVVSTLWNVITRFVLMAAARVLVSMIQVVKVPTEGSQQAMEQIKNMMETCLKYLMDLATKMITTSLSSLFDLVKEGVLSWSHGLFELMIKSKNSLDDAVQEIPEVIDAFREFFGKIVADLWNNYNDAVGYVAENVLN